MKGSVFVNIEVKFKLIFKNFKPKSLKIFCCQKKKFKSDRFQPNPRQTRELDWIFKYKMSINMKDSLLRRNGAEKKLVIVSLFTSYNILTFNV